MTTKRLKVFQAHLGFYDTIVAAPSQKAALAAWGAAPGEFAKGFASIATDPATVAQALAKPGKVLRRPAGSKGAYRAEPTRVVLPKGPPHRAREDRAAKLRRKRESEKKAAAREMEKAKQQELREMMRLRRREAELEKEKAKLRDRTSRRIARAQAKIEAAARR